MRTIVGKMDGPNIVALDEEFWLPIKGPPEVDDIVMHKNRAYVYIGYGTYRNITEKYLIATGNMPSYAITEEDVL